MFQGVVSEEDASFAGRKQVISVGGIGIAISD
jgi:hypothetical protein